jgi:hypothetical protein
MGLLKAGFYIVRIVRNVRAVRFVPNRRIVLLSCIRILLSARVGQVPKNDTGWNDPNEPNEPNDPNDPNVLT